MSNLQFVTTSNMIFNLLWSPSQMLVTINFPTIRLVFFFFLKKKLTLLW